jgi:hypothetical protein
VLVLDHQDSRVLQHSGWCRPAPMRHLSADLAVVGGPL